jgi:hypothetical protein
MIVIRPCCLPATKPWFNLETSMCVPATADANSNVFGLPSSFAAPLSEQILAPSPYPGHPR